MKRSLIISVATALLVTAACGSDDDSASNDAAGDTTGSADPGEQPSDDADATGDASGDTTDADESDGASDDAEPAEEAAPADDAVPTGSGTATVTFEGETYDYAQIEPGPDDDWYVFCTTIGDSLQAVMQQVDDAGNVVVGGEISVILLEPGGAFDQTGDPPEVSISIDNERFLQYEEGDPIDAPADGSRGGGTATVREFGSLDAQTGEIETIPHEVEFQVSC